MEKKFWIVLLISMCFLTTNVKAANCTNNSTYKYGYVNENNSWVSYNFANNTYTIPRMTNKLSYSVVDSTIKNTYISYDVQFRYHYNLGLTGLSPSFEFTYGKTGNRMNINSNCSKTYIEDCTAVNDGLCIAVDYVVKFRCSFQGTITDANEIQAIITTGTPNGPGNMTITNDTRCLQLNPNITDDTEQIISAIQGTAEQTQNAIEHATEDIIDNMTPNTQNEFTYDSSKANNLESKEAILKGNLIDPNSLGINNYININPQETNYQNAMTMIWDFISNLIGPMSSIWIITSIILALGSIKLILSR